MGTATLRDYSRFSIFRGEARESTEPTVNWTIRDFYDLWAKKNYIEFNELSEDTARLYRQAIGIWEEVTDNPPLYAASQVDFDDFVKALKKRPGRDGGRGSSNTVIKLCSHFQKLWDLTGPRTSDRRTRRNAQLLTSVPYFERPPKTSDDPDGDFSIEEVGRLLGAAEYAQRTSNILGVLPSAFWKALYVFLWNTGLRIETAMCAEWSMVDSKKSGWIHCPKEIMKKKQRAINCYLNAHARAAIESVKTSYSKRLFPWMNFEASFSWLYEMHRRNLTVAGISEDRRFAFHGLRKALGTNVADLSQGGELAEMALGHKQKSVAFQNYINKSVLTPLLDALPQPTAIPPENPPAIKRRGPRNRRLVKKK